MTRRGLAVLVSVICMATSVHGANLVRNASFELDQGWNGTTIRVEAEFYQAHARTGNELHWNPVAEAWWQERADKTGVAVVEDQACSGKRCVRVKVGDGKARSVISSYDRFAEPGPWVLSAQVKTAGAKGRLCLVLSRGWRVTFERGDEGPSTWVDLPADSDWTRVHVALDCPERLEIQARLVVEAGTVWMDDAQIEPGTEPTAFNVRPEEWLRVQFADHDNTRLPLWLPGWPETAAVEVWNDSRLPLTGAATVFMGTWDAPDATKLAEFPAAEVQGDQPRRLSFATKDLVPDAYLVMVRYREGETLVLDGAKDFHPTESIGGHSSLSQFTSRLVGRFAIGSPIPPANIFGVGNGMLSFGGGGNGFAGYRIEEYLHAGEIGVVCSRGPWNEDLCYLHAAGGFPIHAMGPHADQGGRPEVGNPANPAYIDVYNPEGLAYFKEQAEEVGKVFAANPMVASFQLHNEQPYIHNGGACPSTYADAHFRHWCKDRHGDLATLNDRWGTDYESWDQVEQVISARFVEEEKNRPKKEGAAAIEWTAAFRSLPETALKRFQDTPGWAMDWLRWRGETSVWAWATFMEHARKYDTRTLYGNNLAWPTFFPQVFMPLIRVSDAVMVDQMYTSGWPLALGTPQEMLEILEMAESTEPGKPILGAEVYVQPSWPGEFAGMQNWAMVAHGMTINLVFGWKPYSDHGQVEGARAWEKDNARPMWFLIDSDGTKLPHYEHYRRTVGEIERYHKRFDGHSIKRVATDAALYVSLDTAEYITLQTGEKPWGSPWVRTRNNLLYTLRMEGITADFVDDATLPEKVGRFNTIIVPASYVLSQEAAGRLESFAESGGTVVLAGISGLVDPWLRPYENVGGPAWTELGWKAPAFAPEYADVRFGPEINFVATEHQLAADKPGTVGGAIDPGINEGKTFRGVNIGSMANAEEILDASGHVVGWRRAWGQGRLIAYGPFPDTYVTNPHPSANIRLWVRRIIEQADLEFTGRWVDSLPPATRGHLGTGDPVTEVVVREKSPVEKFVFALNQGGPGDGIVQVPVGEGQWTAQDVVTERDVTEASVSEGLWSMPLHMDPWSYRVIWLRRSGQ